MEFSGAGTPPLVQFLLIRSPGIVRFEVKLNTYYKLTGYVCFFAFFLQKTALVKIHFMNLVLISA